MSLPRFFVEQADVDSSTVVGETFYIAGDAAHHAGRVLRMQPGEQLVLSRGDGFDYVCELTEFREARLHLRLLDKQDNRSESLPQITLWQGLPKAAKFEEIIEKSVELGVFRIVPLRTQRSLIKLDDKAIRTKQSRWQKIAESAAKQSGRGLIPEVAAITSFEAALRSLAFDIESGTALAFIPWEEATEPSLKAFIKDRFPSASAYERLHFFIGPEGGFSAAEIALALESGVSPLTLGPRILRTETAGPAVLAMLSVLLPDSD